MDTVQRTAGRTLQRELAEVEAAIALVGSGVATTVSVSGLHFGEAILAKARESAANQGVDVEPIWWPDDAGCDVIVRRRHA